MYKLYLVIENREEMLFNENGYYNINIQEKGR